jgi:hypothetical protein
MESDYQNITIMIAKAKSVSYGANITNYAMGKTMARIVKFNLLPSNISPYAVWSLMLTHQAKTRHLRDQRKELKNNVIKMEISPAKEETKGWDISDWEVFVGLFVKAFDSIDLSARTRRANARCTHLANSQYIAALHLDAKSGIPHIHLVANRIDNDGQTIDDHCIALRAMAAARIVSQKYGWKNPEDISTEHKRQITVDCMQALQHMDKFDWDEYVRQLTQKGYEVRLRKDKSGKVVGYHIKAGNSCYKASCLADTKKLNAAYIEKTWHGLHPTPSSIQQRPVTKNSPTAFVTQRIQVEYREYPITVSKDIRNFIHEEAALPGTEILTSQEVSQVALLLFAGYLDGATSLAASCGGGGSSNDLSWGRDPREDDREWARRCVQRAKELGQPRVYRRRR